VRAGKRSKGWFRVQGRGVFSIADSSNHTVRAAKGVLTIVVLAVVFTIILAQLTATFNITGLLSTAITLLPGILGLVAILKVLDLI
jgi:hypothetical protein